MKRFTVSYSLALFLLLITAFNGVAQSRVDEIRQSLLNPELDEVLVVAHRGDWRYAPENSLAAISNAIEMGVDVVEIDVRKTKDGQLVLMHDKTLDRTTTGKGNVSDWTLDSIKTLWLRNGAAVKTKHRVPTLEEALVLAKGKAMLNLDKAYGVFDEVYGVLAKTGTADHIIMKGSQPVQQLKSQFGHYLEEILYMPVVNLDRDNAAEIVSDYVTQLQPVAFELVYKSDTNQLTHTLARDLDGKSLIWYNTLWPSLSGGHDDDFALEDPDKAYGYLIDTLRARIIQTDRPAYLIEYLQERKKEGKVGK
ncbi:glycerophosphodiester phosphodiesterase family protein [Parapedobacter sp. 10938]|uniref:glycerophosphodiester phosphodiesterase family protein n=1 Tax=Parapedobacter flavus TaxID=3110225 RepID=UPI002DBBAB77|nr:glycerophosphodiester phosphodiesterase family protein [Parapedobacter sp. 10938]MEC3879443.1 glycerophosphodiester phosphodiesterase family protein [Parapedobacter sp. 10938]